MLTCITDCSLVMQLVCVVYYSLNNQVVALKEIRLQEEEGAPFTAIREGEIN